MSEWKTVSFADVVEAFEEKERCEREERRALLWRVAYENLRGTKNGDSLAKHIEAALEVPA